MNIFDQITDSVKEKKISEEDKVKILNFSPDPIAEKTLWWNCNPSGSKYQNYSLGEKDNILEYHFSNQGIIRGILFILAFGYLSISDFYKIYAHGWVAVDDKLYTIIYTACLLWATYYFVKNIKGKKVFDKTMSYFYIGKMPVFFESDGKTVFPFSQIHALQIISEFIPGKYGNYKSYELNLILKDATRVNIVDHKNIEQIRLDAQKTSKFLGVPVWDITL